MTERRKGRRPELPFLPAFSYIARPRKTAHKGAYMAAALPLKRPVKVGELVLRRLRELKRTPRELADAVQVPEVYIADLVAGRRRRAAPGRMAVDAPLTKFRMLHRSDVRTCTQP